VVGWQEGTGPGETDQPASPQQENQPSEAYSLKQINFKYNFQMTATVLPSARQGYKYK
jgi:hypothetical protein